MTNTGDKNNGLNLLETTLETYGADRTRWPADVRRQLSGLLNDNAEAKRLLVAGTALDSLLDMAPSLSDARLQALSDRIVSAAKATPRVVISSQPVRRVVPASRRENWAAGMALAASLVLGIYAGSRQSVVPTLQEIASVAGLAADANAGPADSNDDSENYSNEDVL